MNKEKSDFQKFIYMSQEFVKRPSITLKDGTNLSIQASANHYSIPQKNFLDEYEVYEIGTDRVDVIEKFEEYNSIQYGNPRSDIESGGIAVFSVTQDAVERFISEHGGIDWIVTDKNAERESTSGPNRRISVYNRRREEFTLIKGELTKDEPWIEYRDGSSPFQKALDLFEETYFERDGSIKKKIYPFERQDRTDIDGFSDGGSKIIGNSLFAPEIIADNGRLYLGVDYQSGFDHHAMINQSPKARIDITDMSHEEVMKLAEQFLEMSNEEIMQKFGSFGGYFDRPAMKFALRCHDEIVKYMKEDGLVPTYRSAVGYPETGIFINTPEGRFEIRSRYCQDKVEIQKGFKNICEVAIQNNEGENFREAGLKVIDSRSQRDTVTPLEERLMQAVLSCVNESRAVETETKTGSLSDLSRKVMEQETELGKLDEEISELKSKENQVNQAIDTFDGNAQLNNNDGALSEDTK